MESDFKSTPALLRLPDLDPFFSSRSLAYRYLIGTLPSLFTGISYFPPSLVVTVMVMIRPSPYEAPAASGAEGSVLCRT